MADLKKVVDADLVEGKQFFEVDAVELGNVTEGFTGGDGMDESAVAFVDIDGVVGVWGGCADVDGEGCGRLGWRDVGLWFGGVGEGYGRIAAEGWCAVDAGIGTFASGEDAKDENETNE